MTPIERAREAAAKALLAGQFVFGNSDDATEAAELADAAINAALASLSAQGLVIVPKEASEEMVEAFRADHPYILRRNKEYDDGAVNEIVRQDHPDWREVIADPMTLVARYADRREAEAHYDDLVFAYRYAAMIAVASAAHE